MSAKAVLAGIAAVAIGALMTPAKADNILENQWYTGHFNETGSLLYANTYDFGVGEHGPTLPPGTFADAVAMPGAFTDPLNAVITLASTQYLTVTDVEISGDQFQIFINGLPATPAPVGANGLTPSGQQALVGGFTSVPVFDGTFGHEDIAAALADSNYSSGTFYLSPGVNVITGTFLGNVGFGDFDFIVTSPSTVGAVPEPSTLSLLGFGLAGLGLFLRRRKQAAAAGQLS